MPRLPRVSGAETIRALERLGFAQIRQRGSHVVLKRIGHRQLPAASFPCILSWPSVPCAESSSRRE